MSTLAAVASAGVTAATLPAGVAPVIPGYTGGFTAQFATVAGKDLRPYLGKGYRFSDLISMGVLSPTDVLSVFPDLSDPLTTAAGKAAVLSTNIDSFIANNQAGEDAAVAALPQVGGGAPAPVAPVDQAASTQGVAQIGLGGLVVADVIPSQVGLSSSAPLVVPQATPSDAQADRQITNAPVVKAAVEDLAARQQATTDAPAQAATQAAAAVAAPTHRTYVMVAAALVLLYALTRKH